MTHDLIKELEFLQLDAWERSGIAESEVSAFFLKLRDEFVARDLPLLRRASGEAYGVDAQIDRQIENDYIALFSRPQVTRFQNPITATLLNNTWKAITPIIADGSGEHLGSLPIIASAPTGNINAFAIRGENDSSAIVFEEELISTIQYTCILVAFAISTNQGDHILINPDPASAAKLISQSRLIHDFDRLFWCLVAYGRGGLADEVLDAVKTDLNRTSNGLVDGALRFVMGHELVHLDRGHHFFVNESDESIRTRHPLWSMALRSEKDTYAVSKIIQVPTWPSYAGTT